MGIVFLCFCELFGYNWKQMLSVSNYIQTFTILSTFFFINVENEKKYLKEIAFRYKFLQT